MKKMYSSAAEAEAETEEELKIPVLENTNLPPLENISGCGCACCDRLNTPIMIITFLLCVFYVAFPLISQNRTFTTNKLDIRLASLIFCTTNTTTSTSNNLIGILDLKFNITNPNYHADICIQPFEFEVSVFSDDKFLTKMSPLPYMCIPRGNHTSEANLFADVSLFDHPNHHQPIRFDLKIQTHFWFMDQPLQADYGVDLVCQDAKVPLSTSNNSCASMLGDPFMCSYV